MLEHVLWTDIDTVLGLGQRQEASDSRKRRVARPVGRGFEVVQGLGENTSEVPVAVASGYSHTRLDMVGISLSAPQGSPSGVVRLVVGVVPRTEIGYPF